MKLKLGIWFDRSLAIIGLILTLIPTAQLLGLIKNAETTKVLLLVNLLIGLAILVIFYKGNRSISISSGIETEKLLNSLKEEMRHSEHVYINNPDNSDFTKNLIQHCHSLNLNLSISGEANKLNELLKSIEPSKDISKFISVLRSTSIPQTVILYDTGKQKIVICYFKDNQGALLKITGKGITKEVKDFLQRNLIINAHSIGLDQITNPSAFLDIIENEKKRFNSNFSDLKSGFISFYGTEVQNVQSGWLESNRFKTIRTLDITTNPGLLLTRERYIKSNRNFISKGGTIQRVYLIEKSRLNDSGFREALIAAIKLQTEIGVSVGVQLIHELKPEQQQDFILYDNFVCLVEEKQANSDYTFGKSTAYFAKNKLDYYGELFDAVWSGQIGTSDPRVRIKELNLVS